MTTWLAFALLGGIVAGVLVGVPAAALLWLMRRELRRARRTSVVLRERAAVLRDTGEKLVAQNTRLLDRVAGVESENAAVMAILTDDRVEALDVAMWTAELPASTFALADTLGELLDPYLPVESDGGDESCV